ncbi:hypothetical protein BIU88_01565 [Chlorobaculum limnaeum]|uniref:DUF4760 domain-containing protein n=1 Tax=Chlorobaculum limnaeum TaxID=274537 RepID=A0A1D8D2B7_CHLLM|nr:hypothetical protein [Chlorobaculum limnaeum]AOS82947.1 hypothetical protein BIU88_01565 [Chlorobaculum limnaeum]
MGKNWLDYITAIGSIFTPILVLLLTGIGWHIKAKIERNRTEEYKVQARIRELEDMLRVDRIEIYNQLLEPFFVLFTSDAIFASDPEFKGNNKEQLSIGKMLTVEYRKVGFKLSLVADDAVVRAYNNLMQFFYKGESEGLSGQELLIKTSQWIKLLSDLLLEIRKSMGNEHTSLNNWEMIEWFMSDAESLREMWVNCTTNRGVISPVRS